MKLLIATPAYGGLVTTKFLLSLLKSIDIIKNQGKHQVGFYTVDSDSLITRARNTCAKFALENGVDKLLFIDADINWEHWQIEELLKSDKPVIGGTYPIKHTPIKLNFNALMENALDFSIDRRVPAFKKFAEKYAAPNGEVEIRHLPTGFMLIDCSVFRKLNPAVKIYKAFDAGTMKNETYHDYFPVQITDGNYETEDWGFCTLCRANNIPIYLQTKVILKHIGKYEYNADDA